MLKSLYYILHGHVDFYFDYIKFISSNSVILIRYKMNIKLYGYVENKGHKIRQNV